MAAHRHSRHVSPARHKSRPQIDAVVVGVGKNPGVGVVRVEAADFAADVDLATFPVQKQVTVGAVEPGHDFVLIHHQIQVVGLPYLQSRGPLRCG